MNPNTQGNLFPIQYLCVPILVTWKLHVVYEYCTYWMTALLMTISIFCVRAGCKTWLVSYGSKHSSQFFQISHLYALTRINWKLRGIYGRSAYRMTALLPDTFLVWFRVAREIWLERYSPRSALVVLWYKIVCIHVYCNHAYIHYYLVCNYAWQLKLMYLMTAYYTPNNGFTANDASYYKNKVGYSCSYTIRFSVFSINRKN